MAFTISRVAEAPLVILKTLPSEVGISSSSSSAPGVCLVSSSAARGESNRLLELEEPPQAASNNADTSSNHHKQCFVCMLDIIRPLVFIIMTTHKNYSWYERTTQ